MKININKVSLIVWIVTIIVLVASTLVRETFYDQWWFVALLFVFAATALFNIIIRKLWRRPVVCAIHTSVILILLGGFLSFTTSQNGSLKVLVQRILQISFLMRIINMNCLLMST